MPRASLAEPRTHPLVGTQLIRSWTPEGRRRAEIVLVHGLAEHTGRYERVGTQLAEAGYAVRGADLIGFGGSGGRRGYVRDWAHYLHQIQALVEEAKATGKPTVLLGHSMGGLLALEYALADRPAPDLLVLSAPLIRGGTRFERRLAAVLEPLAPIAPVPNRLRGEQLSRDPAVGEAYFNDPLVYTSTTGRLGHLMFEAMDRTAAVALRLQVRTLVLHGDHDSIVPSTCTVALGALPMVDRRRYSGLRHELFNEPEGPEVVADVVEWLTGHLD